MNRTDRLVAIVLYLQGRRLVRAAELASHFEITVRTVYRDVAALGEAGVPIVGEAGVGYSLVRGYHLPPVMLTSDEASALFLAGELAARTGDRSITEPTRSALLKLRSVLPAERQEELTRLARVTSFPVWQANASGEEPAWLLPLQKAATRRRVVEFRYQGVRDASPRPRSVEPLAVAHRGGMWYLVAWCRMRKDHRSFRLDRIRSLKLTDETFPEHDFDVQEFLSRLPDEEARVEVEVYFSETVVARAKAEAGREARVTPVPGDGVRVVLRTYEIEWVARWVLAYAGEAVALRPPALVDRVRELAQLALTAEKRFRS
ncbi:helix-turn-helix transcriptional regulator [Nibricoccus sp. IMCC34717]|uniref:helix-turn-helix transcriptional regulator n=1 Tax=Nibricoccus sp. IMCC34717 TaxID=3034021 RepID=UPI00384E9116